MLRIHWKYSSTISFYSSAIALPGVCLFAVPLVTHITSHRIASHHITSHHITSRTPRYATPRLAAPRRDAPRHVTSRHGTSYHIISYIYNNVCARAANCLRADEYYFHITSRHATPRLASPRRATARHATPRHVTSRHITSHHIIAYRKYIIYIENVCTRVANFLRAHESVTIEFISRVAQQRGK